MTNRAITNLRWATAAAAAGVRGVLLATTVSAAAATDASVSPRDDCGGFNGHVVWPGPTSPSIQIYGEVWDSGCSGSTSVWLSWNSPTYDNIQAQAAGESQTEGVNYETSLSTAPQDIKVAVCSTDGGWHCGDPVAVTPSAPAAPTQTTTPTVVSTPVTSTPTTPTVSAPVTSTPTPTVIMPVITAVPQPAAPSRTLRIWLTLSWTWDRAITRLGTVKVGRFPVHTRLLLRCVGHGCPRPVTAAATGGRSVHRLLRRLQGERYRAGDRLLISLQAFGWRPEQAAVEIRAGRKPTVTLPPS
jgi:hypothetical protein